jgi:hypothetical protein
MLIVILVLLNICVKHKFSPKLLVLIFGGEGKLQAVWVGFRAFNVFDVTCFRDPKCCLNQFHFAPLVYMHSFFPSFGDSLSYTNCHYSVCPCICNPLLHRVTEIFLNLKSTVFLPHSLLLTLVCSLSLIIFT